MMGSAGNHNEIKRQQIAMGMTKDDKEQHHQRPA
jgi:hypothetical protein